jgi:hypothetical protein
VTEDFSESRFSVHLPALTSSAYVKTAAEIIKKVLKKRREVLDEDYSSTITTINNLINTLRD